MSIIDAIRSFLGMDKAPHRGGNTMKDDMPRETPNHFSGVFNANPSFEEINTTKAEQVAGGK